MSDRPEKYTSAARYYRTKLQRAMLRAAIRPLIGWDELRNPEDGYTVIIGVACPLERIAIANLSMLRLQRRDNLKEILLVCDRPKDQVPTSFEEDARAAFPDLPLRFLYWTDKQRARTDRLKFPWIDSWLSWCTGIAACKTRHALLHDLDAMLLRDDLLEDRYRLIKETGDSYVGVKWYDGNGIMPEDRFVVTFELMFDAQLVREKTKPIDLFNHVRTWRGRRVEMDTFLHAQTIAGSTFCDRVDGTDMVHPSQLFCQFNDLRRRSDYTLPEQNNLPLVPYFLHLAGDDAALAEQGRAFNEASGAVVRFRGMDMDASALSADHAGWLRQQADRLETALHGRMRDEVAHYFDQIEGFLARRDGANPKPATAAVA